MLPQIIILIYFNKFPLAPVYIWFSSFLHVFLQALFLTVLQSTYTPCNLLLYFLFFLMSHKQQFTTEQIFSSLNSLQHLVCERISSFHVNKLKKSSIHQSVSEYFYLLLESYKFFKAKLTLVHCLFLFWLSFFFPSGPCPSEILTHSVLLSTPLFCRALFQSPCLSFFALQVFILPGIFSPKHSLGSNFRFSNRTVFYILLKKKDYEWCVPFETSQSFPLISIAF